MDFYFNDHLLEMLICFLMVWSVFVSPNQSGLFLYFTAYCQSKLHTVQLYQRRGATLSPNVCREVCTELLSFWALPVTVASSELIPKGEADKNTPGGAWRSSGTVQNFIMYF